MITLERKTRETEISLKLELAGEGKSKVATGIGFFDHMLELFAFHGFIDLELEVNGDLAVDEHHTVEDVGIVLGQALQQALGDRRGLKRYSNITLPMDESLIQVVIDLSGRPYYCDDFSFRRERVGEFPVELLGEFFRALVNNAGMTLHFLMLRNGNAHHLLEACFKGFGRALDQASLPEQRLREKPLSTKGSLSEGGRH